jgi:hypothetical protein
MLPLGSPAGSTCMPDQVDCDGDPANGCETVTRSDADNCGRCGTVCPLVGLLNVNRPRCFLSTCSVECKSGWYDHDGDIENGCESRLAPGCPSSFPFAGSDCTVLNQRCTYKGSTPCGTATCTGALSLDHPFIWEVQSTACTCFLNQCGPDLVTQENCGTCSSPAVCNAKQQCEVPCEGKVCGKNLGVYCGTCAVGMACGDDFQCHPACVNIECGMDPVYNVVCPCPDGMACSTEGHCGVPCVGLECGVDTLYSYICGPCPADQVCDVPNNKCNPP